MSPFENDVTLGYSSGDIVTSVRHSAMSPTGLGDINIYYMNKVLDHEHNT
jgi:hypothetical protein